MTNIKNIAAASLALAFVHTTQAVASDFAPSVLQDMREICEAYPIGSYRNIQDCVDEQKSAVRLTVYFSQHYDNFRNQNPMLHQLLSMMVISCVEKSKNALGQIDNLKTITCIYENHEKLTSNVGG